MDETKEDDSDSDSDSDNETDIDESVEDDEDDDDDMDAEDDKEELTPHEKVSCKKHGVGTHKNGPIDQVSSHVKKKMWLHQQQFSL